MYSPFGRNVLYCCARYQVVVDDFLLINQSFIAQFCWSRVDEGTWTVMMLLELIYVRTGQFLFDLQSFSVRDTDYFIEWLATM
jgi:hypothetical protein